MLAETKVGPQVLSDGNQVAARSGKTGEVATLDAHGRYQEAVYRGNVYLAANQAGTAVTALNATCTGFVLTNPSGSGKLLVLLEVGFFSSAAPAAATILQLAANVNTVAAAVTQTTPLTVRSAYLGASSSAVGLAASSVTLPAAPVAIMNLWGIGAASSITPPQCVIDVAGKIIVQPGTAISLSSTTTMSGAAHMIWEEIAL